MSNDMNHDRRHSLGTAAMAVAGTNLGMLPPGSLFQQTQPAGGVLTKRRTASSFGPLKQIDAGLLNVGYAEEGASDGAPIVLLHGWPSISTATSTSLRYWQRPDTE